jgi:hypothetical protein
MPPLSTNGGAGERTRAADLARQGSDRRAPADPSEDGDEQGDDQHQEQKLADHDASADADDEQEKQEQ